MECEKLFDRLDPNIVLGWFADYDAERTEESMRLSDQKEAEARAKIKPDDNAISFVEYRKTLEERAASGDSEAVGLIEAVEYATHLDNSRLSPEQRHKKELAFFRYVNQKKSKQ